MHNLHVMIEDEFISERQLTMVPTFADAQMLCAARDVLTNIRLYFVRCKTVGKPGRRQ